jgi:hypothetical protein
MMGKACVLCEWFVLNPKNTKNFYFFKKERKNPRKKSGDSEDFGIPFISIFYIFGFRVYKSVGWFLFFHNH